jgi:hypothetical protein
MAEDACGRPTDAPTDDYLVSLVSTTSIAERESVLSDEGLLEVLNHTEGDR